MFIYTDLIWVFVSGIQRNALRGFSLPPMRDYHLSQEELHASVASVARWVKEHFGVHDTDSGMTALLHPTSRSPALN
jgi:hypothetical protein